MHTLDSELAYLNTYPIYDLPDCLEGVVLLNHSHRISMTQGNSRISDRNMGEGPVLMVDQKPEALNLTNNSFYSEHFQIKLFQQRSLLPIPLRQKKR